MALLVNDFTTSVHAIFPQSANFDPLNRKFRKKWRVNKFLLPTVLITLTPTIF